jgi:sugar phosphate isomerase/epimerase
MNKEQRVIISGFADEISNDLEAQVKAIRSLGMTHLSLRTVGDKNIGEYSLTEFKEIIVPILDRYDVKVSSISSPIGKIFVQDAAGFARQMLMAERVCQMAQVLECRYVRVFSFYIPKGDAPSNWREQVMDQLRQLVAIFAAADVIALHENEKEIYGDTAARCKDLFDIISSTHFRGIFDFANFVQCGEKPDVCYTLLQPYIDYFHIKDAVSDNQENVLCGTGEGQIREILSRALANGYQGFLTLEPHLVNFAALKTLELNFVEKPQRNSLIRDGFDGYVLQYQALLGILKEISQTELF